MKKLFLTLKILGAVLDVFLLVVIVYVAYVIIDYERLPDNLDCTVDRTDKAGKAEIGKEYTIVIVLRSGIYIITPVYYSTAICKFL